VAISLSTPTDDVVKGLRAWANSHDSHVRAAVHLLICDGWAAEASFRAVIRKVQGLYVIRWSEARTAFDNGDFAVVAGGHGRARLDLAIAIGENRYKLFTQDAADAENILGALRIAMGMDLPSPR